MVSTMARPRHKKPYHHGDLPRALREAAVALIQEKGQAGFTLRELARRAGVSHAAPYRHFADRDALLACVAEEGFALLGERVAAAAALGASPREALCNSGLAYVEFGVEHPAHLRVMFDPDLFALRPSLLAIAEHSFDRLQSLIVACQRAGDLPEGSAREQTRVAWALMHGVAELSISGTLRLPTPADQQRFRVHALNALFDGV
jgi:AcrR family transcriptional regulator